MKADLARTMFYVFVFSACVSLEACIVTMFVSIWVHAKLVSTVLWYSPLAVAICIAGAVLSSQLIGDSETLNKTSEK